MAENVYHKLMAGVDRHVEAKGREREVGDAFGATAYQ